MTKGVEVRCPKCDYFIFEVEGYARRKCEKCGTEVAVTTPRIRSALKP